MGVKFLVKKRYVTTLEWPLNKHRRKIEPPDDVLIMAFVELFRKSSKLFDNNATCLTAWYYFPPPICTMTLVAGTGHYYILGSWHTKGPVIFIIDFLAFSV